MKWKRLAAVILFLLILILIQVKNPEINGPFRGIVGNVLNPFVYYTNRTFGYVSSIWGRYINLVNVNEKYFELSDENGNLRLENSLLKEKVLEYERLKRLLNFKEVNNIKSTACNIVGRNIEGYIKYFIIDRGEKDGIKLKDPVVSFNGLVGMVSEVYNGTARVDVVLNLNNNVSVMNRRTRTVGIVRGDGRGNMVVDYYDRLDDVRVDDEMITSGLGGVYPKGLPVGGVREIYAEQTGLFQKLIVEPKVDFYKLENVLVISK